MSAARFVPGLAAYMCAERLPASFADVMDRFHVPLGEVIAERRRRKDGPCLVGLCGPQGSGKSTAVAILKLVLQAQGLRVAVLSIDDVYRTRAERLSLASRIHPLLATRGPPGTHDIALCEDILGRLFKGESVLLPRFDKATDDRCPSSAWEDFKGPADIILFEGWCVGAQAQNTEALAAPINALERDLDPVGLWRRYTNRALRSYQPLFSRIDLLIQLRPPSFDVVAGWRREQEAKLRTASSGRSGLRIMTDAEVERFVQYYERLTREILREMPARADAVVDLGPDRDFRGLRFRHQPDAAGGASSRDRSTASSVS